MKVNDDPIIRELRDIRKKTEEECERSGQSYFEHLLEVQEKYKDRLVADTNMFKRREPARKTA